MKQKEDEALFAGRIRDLAAQARQNDYLTHTGFLSLSEQSLAQTLAQSPAGFRAEARRLREAKKDVSDSAAEFAGGKVFYGGAQEADRKVLFFLPSWMSPDELISQEEAGEGVIACLRIEVRGAKFAPGIGHRDCLGALMHLGIGREQVGDILIERDGTAAFAFILASMADHVCRELTAVGRAHVDVRIVPPSACTVKPVLVPRSGTVASVRIDSLVAMVFRISRSAAQALIEREEVFAGGRTVTSSSFVPAVGTRISVRGHGKFIFEGEEKTTRKGRIMVRTSLYS